MKRKGIAGVLAIGFVAVVFWVGCDLYPTMDLNGFYGVEYPPKAAMSMLVTTEFPSATYTGVWSVLFLTGWEEFPISGPINHSNELSYYWVPPWGGEMVPYVWRGLDYDEDGVADALQCKLANFEDCSYWLLPRVS